MSGPYLVRLTLPQIEALVTAVSGYEATLEGLLPSEMPPAAQLRAMDNAMRALLADAGTAVRARQAAR